MLHECLIDLHKTDKIKPLNFENITFLIKKIINRYICLL